MPAVNPEILLWARETAGMTLHDAVVKVGIGDARGVAAVDRLAALERGEQEPTRSVLVRMARHYRRPLLAFYLAAPPPRGDRGADFRTLPETRSRKMDALIDALVRDVRSRQGMIRAVLEAEGEADSLPFVGSLFEREGVPTGTDRLAQRAAEALRDVLGNDLDAAQYYAQTTPNKAFSLLRSRTEDAGVFVLLKGDLGSYHTAIPVTVFRGFAIADDIAPFVVINDQDSTPAWSFTLLHELVHLLLGQTGISGANPGTGIEALCNNVAAEWLLPAEELEQIKIDLNQDITEQRQRISRFARRRNLSHTMVAYRLLRSDRINQQTFNRLRADFAEWWNRERNRRREKARESEGGPTYYVVRRHRVGEALLWFTRRMMKSGALSTTKAAKILSVKPRQVGELLRPARAL